jgi:hypothetical protein
MIDISYMILMNSLSRIDFSKGIFSWEILFLVLFFSSYGLIQNKTTKYLHKIGTFIAEYLPKQTEIEIVGWEYLSNSLYTFEYPHNMKAINYYVYSNNKSKNFRYFNNKRNGVYYSDDVKDALELDNTPNYTLGEVTNIKLEDDIYLSLYIDEMSGNDTNPDNKSNKITINWKIVMTLRSYKYSPIQLQDFINKCMIQYDNYTTNKNKNKTYHFIYQGKNNGKLSFSAKVISDFNNPDMQNYETFDNIFHANKNTIIKDINRLRDIDFYKRTGLKRKKGYLFYGEPGTGKTVTVMGMSNYDKRHIIEVPLSRVKTNNEFEQILNVSQINGIKFNPDNIIIFFDEIDVGTKLKRDNSDTNNKAESSDIESAKIISKAIKSSSEYEEISSGDKLNIGTLLSRLDGIGNYAGIIIVGATNDISNVDKALYRDGRLNLLKFDNASYDDMRCIIERYYQVDINNTQIEILKKLDGKISHAKIRLKLEHYETIDDLFIALSELEVKNYFDIDISNITQNQLLNNENDQQLITDKLIISNDDINLVKHLLHNEDSEEDENQNNENNEDNENDEDNENNEDDEDNEKDEDNIITTDTTVDDLNETNPYGERIQKILEKQIEINERYDNINGTF